MSSSLSELSDSMWARLSAFQSRNRGAFDFKALVCTDEAHRGMFQSRNRGAFDFKCREHILFCIAALSFNLVIEVLLISRYYQVTADRESVWFQSRNQGAFDFKNIQFTSRSPEKPTVSIS